MMQLHYLLFSVSMIITASAAANITEILAELPSCSLNCLYIGLASSPSALSDPRTTCSNITLQASLSACIQSHCNYTEQSEIALVNGQLCAGVPIESRSWAISIVGIVCVLVALTCVALRCYSRYSMLRRLGYDDWIVVTAAVFLIAILAFDLQNALNNGFGRHYWDIDPNKVGQLLKIFYASEMFYIVVITLVKSSILLFYLRVFENSPRFRVADFIVLGIVVSSGLAVLFSIMFQCDPIDGVWDRTITSKCLSTNTLGYATGGISIALDVVILILPIPELVGLHMSLRKKLNIFFMFGLGGLACVTSIVRLKYLVGLGTSTDQTWDNAIPAIWSIIEICVATITACLPAMRALFSHWLPFVFDIATAPNPSGKEKSGPTSNTSSSSSQPYIYRAQKIGPSYNKRVIAMPDDDLLASLDENEKIAVSKIWINPKFDEQGNVLVMEEFTPKRDQRPPSSESSAPFALQGPRESDEVDILVERERFPFEGFQVRKNKVSEKSKLEQTGLRRARSRLKELPPLPRDAVPTM